MSLLNLLAFIEKRPQMYIREKKVELLESFIGGYFLCMSEHNLIKEQDLAFRDTFYDWIFEKYKSDKLNHGISWVNLIVQLSEKNKKNDFDLFFELLSEFKKEKGIV